MSLEFKFYHDAGHGWLQVPLDLVVSLKLPISRCSYKRGKFAYLEEDCDAGKFLDCLGTKPTIIEISHGDNSPIRSYERF
jgi:hypothetical protein